jgi:hypothetical protein
MRGGAIQIVEVTTSALVIGGQEVGGQLLQPLVHRPDDSMLAVDDEVSRVRA